ncbi:3',5'-cyclic-AMP phosphodiesterase [biofilm metagenome]
MTENKPCFSVLQITDPHILAKPDSTLLGVNTAYYFNTVFKHALQSSRKFDLCLLTGDLAQEPCRASYTYLLNTLQSCRIPCLCLPGNHDDFDIMQAVLNKGSVNCNKEQRLGNWQIVALNSQIRGSQGGHLSADELSFMERCLRDNTHLYTLIAVHHHCIPSGSQWMDTMMINNADEFLNRVNRYPQVKAIVNGHIHQVMELDINAVKILTTPSTCFQFKPDSENFSLDDTSPGYRWLELYDDGTLISETVRIPENLEGLQKNNHGY